MQLSAPLSGVFHAAPVVCGPQRALTQEREIREKLSKSIGSVVEYLLEIPALCLFALLIVFGTDSASAQQALKIGDKLPAFELPKLGGENVSLPGAAAGKIAIIHFWASWCPLCVREMAAIEAVQSEYGGSGVACYSINSGETEEAAKAYVAKTKATYTVLLDSKMEVTKQCGVLSIPTTFICDRDGTIRYKILGEVNKMGLEKLLRTLSVTGKSACCAPMEPNWRLSSYNAEVGRFPDIYGRKPGSCRNRPGAFPIAKISSAQGN